MLEELTLFLEGALLGSCLFKLLPVDLFKRVDFALKLTDLLQELLDSGLARLDFTLLRSCLVRQFFDLLRLLLVLLLKEGLQLVRSLILQQNLFAD